MAPSKTSRRAAVSGSLAFVSQAYPPYIQKMTNSTIAA